MICVTLVVELESWWWSRKLECAANVLCTLLARLGA